MKKSSVVQKLNPYYIEDHYYACFRDRMNETLQSYFGGREFINVNISWAIKRLGKMIRCYKLMKKRTLSIIEKNKFNTEKMHITIKYLTRVKFNQSKKISKEIKNEVAIKDYSNKGYRKIVGKKAFQEKRTSIFSHIYYELESQTASNEIMKKSIDSSSSESGNNTKLSTLNQINELKQDLERNFQDKKPGTPRFSALVIE